MIEIKNITKRFGDFVAVNNLSFQINEGEVVGFLGPNGAGKSTTMKMLTGFLNATAGEILIDGMRYDDNDIAIKQRIGYLPEGAPAYGDMTVGEFLHFIADVRGLTENKKSEQLKKVINDVELTEVLHRPIDNLSKGFKRRVGLAQAIMHDPDVLILDEPTDGLDPNQKHHVRNLITNLAKDKIVIVSTHILEEVTAVCNRAIIIASGKKIFDGTPEQLQAKSTFHHAVSIECSQPIDDVSALNEIDGVAETTIDGNRITVKPITGKIIFSDVFKKVEQLGWPVEAIYSEKGRLDDIFRELTVPDTNAEQGV
jgi:ABC-2 type transport system ATP-binding protein